MMNKKAEVKQQRSRPKAVIDEEGCSGCGVCSDFCPISCIEMIEGVQFPQINAVYRVIAEKCNGCTICSRECPWDAIVMAYND